LAGGHRTVKGDLHDIGKNIVASMLEGGGFEVVDLGTDVPPEKFVDAVRNGNANSLPCRIVDGHYAGDEGDDRSSEAGRPEGERSGDGGRAPVTQQYARRLRPTVTAIMLLGPCP